MSEFGKKKRSIENCRKMAKAKRDFREQSIKRIEIEANNDLKDWSLFMIEEKLKKNTNRFRKI